MSQKTKILSHLQAGKSLTHLQAERLFRCCRLAARINELRDQGHDIQTAYIKRGTSRFAKYSLESAS